MTLALAVLDVVVLSDRLVEAVIALSIALVAAENLSPRPAVPRRWVVSFLFGLVHGFGAILVSGLALFVECVLPLRRGFAGRRRENPRAARAHPNSR